MRSSTLRTTDPNRRFTDTLPDAGMAFELARAGDVVHLLRLIDSGVNVDVVDEKGDSLVMLAAYHRHPQVVRVLLAAGADPRRRNARGLSPLDAAAYLGDVATIALLLDAGVGVDEPSASGRTALMWAAAFDRVPAVKLLLGRGADPNALDHDGKDAFTHANALGAEQTAELLADLPR